MSQSAALYHLQTIDTQIDRIKARISEIHRLLGEDEVVGRAKDELDSSERLLAEWRQKQLALENDRAHLHDEAAAAEQRLYSGQIFNPRELADLQDKLVEINHRRDATEDPLLEAMMQVEALNDEIASRREKLNRALQERASDAGELGEEEQALKQELGELDARASQARAAVEARGLSVYDKLRKRPGTVAVVLLKGSECEACGVGLTSQTAQQVRRGELVQCPTCGRILHV